jgi:membrane protease YdiL (CAAX protease family)
VGGVDAEAAPPAVGDGAPPPSPLPPSSLPAPSGSPSSAGSSAVGPSGAAGPSMAAGPAPASVPTAGGRRRLGHEVLLVLGVSLGASAAYSIVSLAAKLTANRPLAQQTATLNASQAPGRPWLDLTYQLMGIFFALVPALLAMYLLGSARNRLGLDRTRPAFDALTGAVLALVIGVPGLGLYFLAHALGVNATVVPAALPAVWWAVPVLVLSAAQNAALEELVVVGYLVTRLRDLGWRAWTAVAASALLRGSYHLYQGFGAFVGNVVMGVVFALFFLRTRRVLPLVVAHTLLDVVSFVGYALLRDRLPFLH